MEWHFSEKRVQRYGFFPNHANKKHKNLKKSLIEEAFYAFLWCFFKLMFHYFYITYL